MRLVIETAPRTKKNHGRIMRMGRFNKVMPSEAFMAFQGVAVLQLQRAWVGHAPISVPVNVRARFYRDALRGDAVGYYQALADVLQKAGVVSDDKVIVAWDGSRLDKDAARPRIELEIEELP